MLRHEKSGNPEFQVDSIVMQSVSGILSGTSACAPPVTRWTDLCQSSQGWSIVNSYSSSDYTAKVNTKPKRNPKQTKNLCTKAFS
jgi:hypothetical protein